MRGSGDLEWGAKQVYSVMSVRNRYGNLYLSMEWLLGPRWLIPKVAQPHRPSQSINHVAHTNWPTCLQFSVQWIGWQSTYIAPSSTHWPRHLQFNVQWISWQCTYLPLLHLILSGHPNPLTLLLCLGRCISN